MAMIDVVNTTTSKRESKDLDADQMLGEIRKQLGDFMKAGDIFIDDTGDPVDVEGEADLPLSIIVKDAAFNIAAGKTASGGDAKTKPTETKVDPAVAAVVKELKKPFGGGGVLEATDLPDIPQWEFAPEQKGMNIGLTGGSIEGGDAGDSIAKMSVGQVRLLLSQINVKVNKKTGSCYGYRLESNGVLKRGNDFAMECAEVNVSQEQSNYTTSNYYYDEALSRLQRSSMAEGTSGVSVPSLFSATASHKIQNATRTDTRSVMEHTSYSVISTKARVTFQRNKVSPNTNFLTEVEKALAQEEEPPARPLLGVFKRFGEFFGTDMVVGGRMNYWQDKSIDQSYNAAESLQMFNAEVEGKIKAHGTDVVLETSQTLGNSQKGSEAINKQKNSIFLKIEGGDDSQKDKDKWLQTVKKYENWVVIGHGQSSLEPTFNYFPADLRARCIAVLKEYFLQQLHIVATGYAGGTRSTVYGDTKNDNVKRIVKIKISHGKNIDGLKITQELKSGELKETHLIGYGRGEPGGPDGIVEEGKHFDVIGPFDPDEEICLMEGGVAPDGLLRQLSFQTTLGKRFPSAQDKYYGRDEGDKLKSFRIAAPRVRSIIGYSGGIVDSVGFSYLDFKSKTASPEFLGAIEPYLFPTNLQPIMKMTTSGMLIAAKWRTWKELTRMDAKGVRNTLITEIGVHSTDGSSLAGFSDEQLVAAASTLIFLMFAELEDRQWLAKHSLAEHRRELITFVHACSGEKEDSLAKFSGQELVNWAFTIKPEAARKLGKWTGPK